MGSSGSLCFYSSLRPKSARVAVARLFDTLTIQRVWAASRSFDQTRYFLKLAQGSVDPDSEPVREREFFKSPSPEAVLDLLETPKTCHAHVIAQKDSDPALTTAIAAIDPAIRGDWAPGTTSYSITVGPHEHFEAVQEVKHFGHAEFSIEFDSSGSPLDWATCRRMVLELPEVKAFAKRLEPILGEVKICVYWDG